MLTWSIALFVVAALGGVLMAISVFNNRLPNMGLALAHGGLAAAALLIALYAVIIGEVPAMVRYGAALLVVAALGGFFLFSFHLRRKAHPKPVVVLHALLAVAGVGCLLLAVL